jgi:hypothetical protein
MTQRPPFFPHRKNKDGSFDSICLECLATFARANLESELEQHDKAHLSADAHRKKRQIRAPALSHLSRRDTKASTLPHSATYGQRQPFVDSDSHSTCDDGI